MKRILIAILLGSSSAAFAGPPLSIDDPGILAPGDAEIILAMQYTSTDAGDVLQAPLLDLSLGVLEDQLQIALVLPHVRADLDGISSQTAFGNAEFGVKWRFLKNDRWQAAFAPYYVFGVSNDDAQRGVGSASDILALPVNVEYLINETWRFNGEVTRFSVSGDQDSWAYGAALAFAARDDMEFLFELAGTADDGFGDHFIDLRVGLDKTVSERFHVLLSVATGLSEPRAGPGLDADLFVGFQWFR